LEPVTPTPTAMVTKLMIPERGGGCWNCLVSVVRTLVLEPTVEDEEVTQPLLLKVAQPERRRVEARSHWPVLLLHLITAILVGAPAIELVTILQQVEHRLMKTMPETNYKENWSSLHKTMTTPKDRHSSMINPTQEAAQRLKSACHKKTGRIRNTGQTTSQVMIRHQKEEMTSMSWKNTLTRSRTEPQSRVSQIIIYDIINTIL